MERILSDLIDKLPDKVLSKEFVLEHGVDFDRLDYDAYGVGMILDDDPDISEKENFFTGLTYSIDDDGNMEFYSYFKDGVKDGTYVRFYPNGQILKYCEFYKGQANLVIEYFENGNLKKELKAKFGVRLWYRVYDENGHLIEEKDPTEEDLLRVKHEEEWWGEAKKNE